MAINCYLAMTAAEFGAAEVLPEHLAWMACHFSCYGSGLSNLPHALPVGAMIIVNDRTPVHKHDRSAILAQLIGLVETQKPSCVLLDFQRPGQAQTAAIAKHLAEGLPCPVGVSEPYAKELDCPVFLPPPPLHVPPEEHLAPWVGREIWLEAAVETERITVKEGGSQIDMVDASPLAEPSFAEPELYCRYHIDLTADAALFTLLRDREQLDRLLEKAGSLGVTQAVGLYQQLG